ncbi:MAG: hypothetical protein ACIAXF_15150 [Phycisphaerales bacterium JB063]
MQKANEKQPDPGLEVLLEAARRAAWDATHGPPHLRAGRFRPEDDPELMERTRRWFEEDGGE